MTMTSSSKSHPTHRTVMGENSHYQFRDQAPIMDEMRLVAKASGWDYATIAEKSGLSASTLYGWFTEKRVRCPRHDSVIIFFHTFGIKYGQLNKLRVVVAAKKPQRKVA